MIPTKTIHLALRNIPSKRDGMGAQALLSLLFIN